MMMSVVVSMLISPLYFDEQDHANRICKWQANNREKAGGWNHPLITWDYIDRREARRRLK
jgi:hypothetical protein